MLNKNLKKYKFLPVERWRHFNLNFGRRNLFKTNQEKIRQQVNDKNGLYVFKRGKEIIYIGKGKPLSGRLKSHNRASFEPVPGDTEYNTFHEFWSRKKNQDKMTIYWKEVELENGRVSLEAMLAHILNPEFETWRKRFLQKIFKKGLEQHD